MKHNLKNRPTYDMHGIGEVETWFEGFEKELREWEASLKGKRGPYYRFVIKEILGES